MEKSKSIICFVLILFIGFSLVFMGELKGNDTQTEYLRIHIRANSNEEQDQSVKLKVRDAVVSFLTPLLCDCDSKEKAQNVISSNLKNIESVADNILYSNGYTYTSSAKINNESFPTRVYEDLTLDAGYYDALIINLGSGSGDNWWCVVYPPLCFTKTTNYIYKSKILQIIEDFFAK